MNEKNSGKRMRTAAALAILCGLAIGWMFAAGEKKQNLPGQDSLAETPWPKPPEDESKPQIDPPARSNGRLQPTVPAIGRRWEQMTKDERLRFVERECRRLSRMIGTREATPPAAAVVLIAKDVDGYARRRGKGSRQTWGEDLESLFGRASRNYAGEIADAFRREGAPPVVGLYLAAIESEWRECLTSPAGAKGMFQFMPGTSVLYGLPAADRCDWRRSATAAARYMKDRMATFGCDATSVGLAIAGYNRGPSSVLRDVEATVDPNDRERSFWTLVANAEKLDKWFQGENVRYVPKFFAAGIVGENPWVFGLSIRPLSSYGVAEPQVPTGSGSVFP